MEQLKHLPDVLQIAGAVWVTVGAWCARRKVMAPDAHSYDGMDAFLRTVQNSVAGQFRDQTIGLGLMGVGFTLKLWM